MQSTARHEPSTTAYTRPTVEISKEMVTATGLEQTMRLDVQSMCARLPVQGAVRRRWRHRANSSRQELPSRAAGFRWVEVTSSTGGGLEVAVRRRGPSKRFRLVGRLWGE